MTDALSTCKKELSPEGWEIPAVQPRRRSNSMGVAIRKYQPKCIVSHNFINKLSVIIGSCQLLKEKAEHSGQFDPECMQRLAAIHEIAKAMADELRVHQGESDSVARVEIFEPQSHRLKVPDGKH